MNALRSRPAWLLLVGCAVSVTFALQAWLAVRNPHVGLLADDALYLLMADLYSPYREAAGAVYEHVQRYSHLPPFYPLLLAVAGAGAEHLLPARVATAAFMAGAWFLLYVWLRQRGAPRRLALAWALFAAWTPASLLYTVDLWSEGLYMALVLCALVLEAGMPRRPSVVLLLGLALSVACAMQTRGIGLALVPAVLLGLWRRSVGCVAVFCLGGVAMLAAFKPLDMGAEAAGYTALLAAHYATDPLAVLSSQLAAVAAALPHAALYDFFGLRGVAAWQWPALLVIALAVAFGLWREIRTASVSAVYVAGYLAIALTWPFPEQTDRFLYPLLPVLCAAAWRATASRRWPAWLPYLPLACAVALAAPGLYALVVRAATPLPVAALESFRSTRYWLDATRAGDPVATIEVLAAQERAAAIVDAQVPVDACVYTANVHLVLLKGRRTAFLPPPPARMAQGAPWDCAYFLLTAEARRGRPGFYPLDYLRQHGKGLALVRRDEADPDSTPLALLMRAR